MTDRPTRDPRWATNDIIDATTGQNNVVEPSEPEKDAGWGFQQKPPYNFFNWLHRVTYQWLSYFQKAVDQFSPHEASTPDMTVVVEGGKLRVGTGIITVAQQTTAALVAPAVDDRVDLLLIDRVTGILTVQPGVESGIAVAPDVNNLDKIILGEIELTSSTTEITNNEITDSRVSMSDAHSPGNISGFKTGTSISIESSRAGLDSVFSISAVIGAAWESVGPTGSGATNEWPGLDSVPANAKGVILKIRVIATGYGAVASYHLQTKVYGRETGGGAPVTTSSKLAELLVKGYSDSVSIDYGVSNESTFTVFVPLDENGMFDLYFTTFGSTNAGSPSYIHSAFAYLVGWIE